MPKLIILILYFSMLVFIKIGNGTLCNYLTALKNVTEMKTYHLFKTCEKNNDKGYIRNIQIKCTIINTVQYKMEENKYIVVQHQ